MESTNEMMARAKAVAAVKAQDFPEYGQLFWDWPTVAKVLGIGQSTVTFLTHAEPTFPKPIKISNATRWKAAEVIAWANAIQTNSFVITGPITPSAKNTKKINRQPEPPEFIKRAMRKRVA